MTRRLGFAVAAAMVLTGSALVALPQCAAAEDNKEGGAGAAAAVTEPTREPASETKAEAAPVGQPASPQVAATTGPDAIIVAVRAQIARTSGAEKSDLAALTEFYAEHPATLFTSASGLTPRGEKAIAEIRKADDWGLEAKAFELPQLAGTAPEQLAAAEIKLGLAALRYARFAAGGRVDPGKLSRYLDFRPTLPEPRTVLAALASGDDADKVLTSYHPKHPQFLKLRQALLELRAPAKSVEPAPTEPPQVQIPDGPLLKANVKDARVALLRERLGVVADGDDEQRYDAKLVEAVKAFQRENELAATGTLNAKTRAALNGVKAVAAKPSRERDIERVVLSMERWRWMPGDLGQFYVWDNVPEFTTRVMRGDTPVHMEKIIVGKTDTPTPMFSAKMQFIIFHPEWGVPDSIKVKEILPYLKRPSNEFSFFGGGGGADTRVLQKHNLRVSYNGRPVDAAQVDWSNVDIRQFQFIQPSGGQNVLGVVKFRFPNRHDVYMHDTPQRDLFAQKVRAFSHGCMRVHNPQRLAEVLLAEDRGMSSAEVARLIAQPQSTEITLNKQFPVHITYLTAVVDEEGRLQTFNDLYGHDARLQLALTGKQTEFYDPPAQGETSPGLAPVARGKAAKGAKYASQGGGGGLSDVLSGLFGN